MKRNERQRRDEEREGLIGCIGTLLSVIGRQSTNPTVLEVRRYLASINVVVDDVDVGERERAADFAKKASS